MAGIQYNLKIKINNATNLRKLNNLRKKLETAINNRGNIFFCKH